MAIKKTIKNERHQVIHPITEVDAVEGLNEALAQKQDVLVSGVNIKTINGESLLGPGNMIIDGGGSTISVDTEMSDTSENPVQNKVITQAISGFITKSVDDLVNYYLKSETYNKTEVDSLIAAVNQFSYEVAASLPTASASTMYKIYLIPSSRPETQNVKDEYITIRSGSEGSYTYSWEQIGSTAIDLSDYVTTSALNAALASYTTTAQLNTLLAAKQDVINDLSTIRSGAAAGATAYQKPSGGIPKTDLNSGVQASLDLADSAVQADPVGSVTPPVDPSAWATAEEVSQLQQKVSDISTGKYYGYYATVNDLPDDADVDGFAYVGTGPTYTIYNCDNGVWASSGLTVNQSPIGNEEDIDQDTSGKLQFADRTYNAQQPNGMGYVILRKNKTFAEQVTAANTIYEIRYDFDLNSASVTIPAGCVLKFNGGILKNGTITGQATKIDADLSVIFNSITLSGTFVARFNAEWFGCSLASTSNQDYINNAIVNLSNIGGGNLYINGDYTISDTIFLRPNVSLVGCKTTQRTWGGTMGGKATIKCAFVNKNKWIVDIKDTNGNITNYSTLVLDHDTTPDLLQGSGLYSISFVNVSETGTEAIFGGIRLVNFTGKLHDVYVDGVSIGISLNWSWFSMESLRLRVVKLGAYFGQNCTFLRVLNSSFITTPHFTSTYNVLGIDSANLTPPYTTVSTVAIVQHNSSNLNYGANATFLSSSFEQFDCVALMYKAKAFYTDCYFETIRNTYIFNNYGLCEIHNNLQQQDYGVDPNFVIEEDGTRVSKYEFGAKDSGTFVVSGITLSRFYSADDYSLCTVIDNGFTILSYYDNIRFKNNVILEATKNIHKRIVGAGCGKNVHLKNTGATPSLSDSAVSNPDFRTGESVREQTTINTFYEILKEMNGNPVHLFSDNATILPQINDGFVKITNTHRTSSVVVLDESINIKDSSVEITYDAGFNLYSVDSLFEAAGNCEIVVWGRILNATKYIVKLVGTRPCKIKLDIADDEVFQNYYTDRSRVVFNEDFAYAYSIDLYHKGVYVRSYSNTARPTASNTGETFFDSTLGKMIVWNGSAWVNMDGTALS